MMIASKAAIAVCSFVLVAAGGAAIIVGGNGLWQAVQSGPKVDQKAEPGAVAESQAKPAGTPATKPDTRLEAKAEARAETRAETKVASAAPDAAAAPLTPPTARADVNTALGQVKTALADLPTPTLSAPPPAAIEQTGPRFDVARVDDDGEAVIAGRAAPGAKVDLLRDGETHASTVADASGMFVMTPPKLPAGSYKLSLKSTAPDGTVVQSRTDMPVTLKAAAAPPPRTAPARVEVAKAANDKGTPEIAKDAVKQTARSESPAPAQAAPQSALALAAAPSAEKGPLQPKAETTGSLVTSRIVARGDSLWLISRRAYGDGANYALIYRANRAKIHDPDRIYPGQTFVVPRRER
jgi:nucleoid-associated protein YgaU